jgi:class 3 adenylate cyclase
VRQQAQLIRGPADAFGAPPYVRRDEAERWCNAALTAMVENRAHVGLVAGEPGIGKTRLLRELGARAVANGVTAYVGRGWEGAAVPFAAFSQALYSGRRAVPRRRAPRASDERVLASLIRGSPPPSLRRVSGAVSETARFASKVVRAVMHLAQSGPTLLVLDDLQWLDPASLDTFELLAFALADAQTAGTALPLVLIGGLRPPAPGDRVARTLARLERESGCDLLRLRGFHEDELSELLSTVGIGTPTHQMVATLLEATGGNPLFALEVARQLHDKGVLKRHGRFVSIVPGAVDVPLPADVHAALRARMTGLEGRARELLTIGALLGDPFDLRTLCAVADVDVATAEPIADAWVAASLASIDRHRVQFAHPLLRQSLIADMSLPRRCRLHAHIADRLARMDERRDDDRQLEIASHLVSAGSAADPARIVAECLQAGALASARHAWTDAARFYEAALAAAGCGDDLLAPSERADLHFRAGFAHYRDQDAGLCLAQFDAAIATARTAGDLSALARALLGRIRARFTLVSVSYGTRIETDDVEAVIDQIAADEPILAAFGWSEIAQVLWTAKQPARARVFAERALALATRHNSPMVAAEAHRALSLISAQELQPQAALEHLDTGLEWARRGKESWIESQILQRLILPLLWVGNTERIESVASEAAASTQLIHDWGDHSLAHGGLTCWAVACGEFERAEQHAGEVLRLLRRSGYPWAGPTALPALALARMLRGAWAEAEQALAMLAAPGDVFVEPGPDITATAFLLGQVLHAWRSPDERASIRERLEPMMPQLAIAAKGDIYALGLVSASAECAPLLGSVDMAQLGYDLLREAHERGVVFTTGWVSLLPRVLGETTAHLERWDEATKWFEQALRASANMGARAEQARTALGFAAMLQRRQQAGDAARALELLAIAVPQLRDLGMGPSLAAATQLARELTAPADETRADRQRRRSLTTPAGGPLLAMMFTDIVGSTAAYERFGDAAGRALVRAHDTVVRDWVGRCSGTLMKHTGDGILAAFASVASSLDCAVALQRAFTQYTRRHPKRPLHVRIGINVGEPLAEDGDLFGTAVNTAARVCARARGGEILVTDAVHRLAELASFQFQPRGRVTLRGIRSSVRLFEVTW